MYVYVRTCWPSKKQHAKIINMYREVEHRKELVELQCDGHVTKGCYANNAARRLMRNLL